MSDDLRRGLADLAEDAGTGLSRPVTVAGLRARRRTRIVGAGAALVLAVGAVVVVGTGLDATGGDRLVQQLASPSASASADQPTPTPSATPVPAPAVTPTATASVAETPSAPTRSAEPRPTYGPVVGWQPSPVASTGPDPAPREAPQGLRRCGPADLDVRVATDFAAPQAARRTVVLSAIAVGSTDCGVDGHGFALVFPGSPVRPVHGSASSIVPDLLVRPGDRLVLVGFVVNWCEPERGPVRVALSDGSAQYDAPGTITPPACAEEQYGSRDPQAGASVHSVARAGSPLLLVPRLTVPAAVAGGARLRYDVELLNASDRPVRFDPCPGFTHALGELGTSDPSRRRVETHALDCAALPDAVPAGERLTVTGISIVAPDRTGRMTLGWSWGGPEPYRMAEIWDGVRGAPVDVR